MGQPDRNTAIRLLNEAMPGMGWSEGGRAGLVTNGGLTEAAANKLVDSLKKNAGIKDDGEMEVRKSDKGYGIAISVPEWGIDGAAADKLMNPMVKAKLQVDTAAAKAESGIRSQEQQSPPPAPSLNNLQAPPTPAAVGGGAASRGK